MFDSLLFDFDGVLADTEPIHFDCWREALFSVGLQLAAERIPPAAADELWPTYERKKAMFRERIQASDPIGDENAALLRSLREKYKLAVVSSSDRSEIEPVLERAGIRPLFQALVCGTEVRHLKPAPDPYLRAAELLAARRPLVIEDSDAGVASGNAAGFAVLRIASPRTLAREIRDFLGRVR